MDGSPKTQPPIAQDTALNLPPITLGLVVACVLVFLGEQAQGDFIDQYFALWPLGENFHIWQPVTYFFLHGGVEHILFNMLGLIIFGPAIERALGPARYLALILISTIAAAITQLALTAYTGGDAPTVGASGGIYGLLLAFAMTFPRATITPLIPPIPMRAPVAVAVFAAIELFSGVTGTEAGVAHFAHLGGMFGALVVILFWRLEAARGRH
jgi:membrane associated rhomboid family serine protease